jgi:hypothetical protein
MDKADFLKAFWGFLFGIVSAYVGLYWKVRKELEAQYDKDLRAERQKVYGPLWRLLQPLARYSPPGPLTASVLKQLSIDLRIWYFEVGGLFMSKNTRDAYFALQRTIVDQIAGGGAHPDRALDEDDSE